jgi:hypothetical protein
LDFDLSKEIPNMAFRNAILFTALAVTLGAFGCSDAGTTTNTANKNTANSNTPAKSNENSPVAVNKAAPEQTTNNAPTLMPVFLAYCTAMEKKDEAQLRKLYSKDTIESFEEDMKEDKVKSLVEFLTSIDKVSTKLCSIRNEVITGDTAVAEVKTETMPNGVKVVFVKEGNEWKLTNKSPDLDAVKQTAPSK